MDSKPEPVGYDVLLDAFHMACRVLAVRVHDMRELLEDIATQGETDTTRFLAVSLLEEIDTVADEVPSPAMDMRMCDPVGEDDVLTEDDFAPGDCYGDL